MAARHWSDDELIARLYGIGPSDGHLEECDECAGRWRVLVAARKDVLRPPEVSDALLAAQRRSIYQRIEQPSGASGSPGFAAALAALVLIVVAMLVSSPTPGPQPSLAVSGGPSETGLFAEIYTTVESTEPQAVTPIHSLFEEEQ